MKPAQGENGGGGGGGDNVRRDRKKGTHKTKVKEFKWVSQSAWSWREDVENVRNQVTLDFTYFGLVEKVVQHQSKRKLLLTLKYS